MTLIDFVNKYIKTKVDFDGHYGPQCVDLYRQYCRDVWKIPHTGAVEGAKDLAERYEGLPEEKKHLCLVKGMYSGMEGDAAVWGATKNNPYGHVAIVLARKLDCMLVFEQDGFKKDGAKLAFRSCNNVIGYLRPWPKED